MNPLNTDETLSADIMDDSSSSDDNLETHDTKSGIIYQKEIVFNKLLPYSKNLDDESQDILREIKGNLGRCVLIKDLTSSVTWVQRLTRYIRLFGLKFSKEDHIIFIKLIYELLTIPQLEPQVLYRLYTSLTTLLKKRELISREELTLPWRPLYDIIEYEMNKSNSNIGMYRFSHRQEFTFNDLVTLAKVYFPASATQEMLDLWRPQLCPVISMSMANAVEYLDTFLPLHFLPHERSLGYELWFNEFMDLWKTCNNAPVWESAMMTLVSRLAYYNTGLIDWEPHIPLMYTRILRSFSLPVHYKKKKTCKEHKFNTLAISYWIVATLGGGSSSQKYLTRLMKVLESYFHPANAGAWVIRLQKFLRKLPYIFICRLNRERNHKPSWLPETPMAARLTDDDITQFVESMAPTVTQAMYSRMPTATSSALQYLATLRPTTVIPRVIDSMYNTMDSLTEPHKYTSAMLSLVSVSRPIVEPNEYTEGPTHVIPLLRAMLPGIDPNDIRKCFITFQAISSFTSMIPLIDSSNASEYWKDLTEEEEVVCAATSQLEDFVIEFLDRCFSLVDMSVLESTRLEQTDPSKQKQSRMEHVVERVIESAICSLLWQTSPQIFKSALHKLHTFVTSRIFETTVSGKCVASICRTFSKVRPEETLKLLVPHFCQIILSHLENENIKEEETLDSELLYNLLLLSEVVRCFNKAVINHADLLERVLDNTIHLKCWEGYNLASKLLANILLGLSTLRPQELKTSNEDFGKHISEYLPVREWGKAYTMYDVKVDWYIPGEAEINYVQKLVAKYLIPELETIKAYIKGELVLDRKELACSLTIVLSSIGCGKLLPVWEDEPGLSLLYRPNTPFDEKLVYMKSLYPGKVTMPDGSNVRKAVLSVITELQDKLLASAEDDIKSLNLIVSILDALLLNYKPGHEEFEAQLKAMSLSKKIFENKLLGKKRHLRQVVVNHTYHQHETLLALSYVKKTESHAQIFYRLLELSTSRYSEVRRNAQSKLNTALTIFGPEDTNLESKIVNILKQDCNLHHEKFKGVLYVLLGPKHSPLITRKIWHFVGEVWPTLLQAQPSEKPSIIALLNALGDTVNKTFTTLHLSVEVKNKAGDIARLLWRDDSLPSPKIQEPTNQDVVVGEQQLVALNESNKAYYLQFLNSILTSINSNLHWRYHYLALEFIQTLVHPDCPYPPEIIRNILQTLIHDTIEFRKIAIRCSVYVLKQQKRKHKYRTIEVERSSPQNYGDREDNQWLQYNSGNVPRSAGEWDQPRFIHNQHVGYYTWPQEVKVNGLTSDQPPLDRTRDQLSPGEREVDDFFSDPAKIDKLISYLSLEEKKGKDKFDAMRFYLFKNLFRNHGDKYLKLFKPHLERLIADKHESNQRCAAEIITGMIRGSKHWPYDKVESMRQYLTPLLRTAFANMTVETVNDWSVLAATASENRDPNRYHWFLELLMEDPLREGASFIDCGRLSALQGALNQQGWRVTELSNRLLEYLNPKLSHPYQLLRERIGSVLVNIFSTDLPSAGLKRTRGPTISQFVSGVMPQLQCLFSISETPSSHPSVSTESSGSAMEVAQCSSDSTIAVVDENGKNTAICLLKTMVKWVTNSVVRSTYSMVPEFWAFLPLVSLMENYEADDELNKICSAMLAVMAQSLVLPEFMPTALAAIQEVCEMSSWSARATCLDFFQVFVFHNMAIICSQDSWVNQVNSLVLRLLKDERVEVREKAGEMLSGLIHCCFISDTQQLMNDLKRLASKQKKTGTNEIAKRHAGVLGLCAFISANPYDVVDPVPEIFLLLGSHLNDPQPIPSSIRKILGDFKRTHHDNWEQHKLKFTEEQLTVLSDMVVPPSYYA